MMKHRRAAFAAATLATLLAATALGSCAQSSGSTKKQGYEFATIGKASIESTVSSTGTLAVVSSVNVLAQMSGRIEKVLVDYNQRVKKGQLLATINTDLLRLQERSAQASVEKYQATYELQTLAVQNSKALFDKGLLSDYDYRSAAATLAANKADLDSAKASLEQIQTEINQYAFITSPLDGIVLARDIDPGSSVVGGNVATSTTLFTIAANLVQMEIEAEVDELDISSIAAGQEVQFTVEADPGRTFSGTVKEVRLMPETSDNLVYYYVIILADNKSGKLLPGMTANVTFIKQKKDNVLAVPTAALRFSPTALSDAERQRALFAAALPADLSQAARTAALARYDERVKQAAEQKGKTGSSAQSGGLTSLMAGRGPGFGGPPGLRQQSGQAAQGGSAQGGQAAVQRKPLWYLDENGKLAALMVQVGLSDATKTEIVGDESLEGRQVILKAKVD